MLIAEKPLKKRPSPQTILSKITVSPKEPKNFICTKDIVIVGGGPSGAYLGYCLAKAGIEVTIIDHTHPREKPCGGILSKKTLLQFPLLRTYPHQNCKKLRLISPSGHQIDFDKSKEHISVSRCHFDRFILNSALSHGCKLLPEKALNIIKENQLWKITTSGRVLRARILVGADGAASIVRKSILTPHRKQDLAIGLGYYTKQSYAMEEPITLKFLRGNSRNLWFDTSGKLSTIGITDTALQANGLYQDLDRFIKSHLENFLPCAKWSALRPQASSPDFFKQPCAGTNWLLLGDAAGHTHPFTGEGIRYALWSAELASQAIIASDLRVYDLLWKKEYGRELEEASNSKRVLYRPATLDKIITFAKKNQTFYNIALDILFNKEHFGSMSRKLLLLAPKILYEAAHA